MLAAKEAGSIPAVGQMFAYRRGDIVNNKPIFNLVKNSSSEI